MQRSPLHYGIVLAGAVVAGALLWSSPPPPRPVGAVDLPDTVAPAPAAPPQQDTPEAQPEPASADACAGRPLVTPSGAPPRINCRDTRAIVAEVHARFAGVARPPTAREFGKLLTAWLDPHGLWSAAPDGPLGRALAAAAPALLEEIRKPIVDAARCEHAEALGAALDAWVHELAGIYDRNAVRATSVPARTAAQLAGQGVFQDDPVTEPARALSRRLAQTVRRFALAYPEFGAEGAEAARNRYFPELGPEGWTEAVLAAALRAYVPSIDPHGDWAPFQEEWSLYEHDPALDGDPRLWREITRTPVGVRIIDGAVPPLAARDVVLAIDGILTAGMPLEQAEQLGRLEPRSEGKRHARVLRYESRRVEDIEIDLAPSDDPANDGPFLDSETVRYGDGHVLVLTIPEIVDGLAETLEHVLTEARTPELRGIVLDLRGNGGGSTDAAGEILGLFLPGAPLFPLASNDKLVEVMHAPDLPPELTFQGPVATLVNGYTASAAEMIAGALASYGRGPSIGARTFGKGCVQEYVDDHQGKGILRVTTLLFALPDGAPVQQTGLTPTIPLLTAPSRERESNLLKALPPYRGPDIRSTRHTASVAWPAHRGKIGPCRDPFLCRALTHLGGPPPTRRARLTQ